MRLYELGETNWKDSQLIFHALAQSNIEAMVLHSTIEPYVCVGLHTDPRTELDLEYCRDNDIGVFRREIGGGTVWLDSAQVFFTLVIRRDREGVPRFQNAFFERFLQPVILALGDLGVKVEFHPICDLLVDGRKISGNGGGEMGECKVLAGSILLDFDHESMARIMRCPDMVRELFRESMRSNVTDLKSVLDPVPAKEEIFSALAHRFQEMLGPMEKHEVDADLNTSMRELEEHYLSDDWLHQRSPKPMGREIKVREGAYIFHHGFVTPEGRVDIICEIADGLVDDVHFPGLPKELAEKRNTLNGLLVGCTYDPRDIISLVNEVFDVEGGD